MSLVCDFCSLKQPRKHVFEIWKKSLFGRTFFVILSFFFLVNLLFYPLSTSGNDIQKKEIRLILLMSVTFLFNALK